MRALWNTLLKVARTAIGVRGRVSRPPRSPLEVTTMAEQTAPPPGARAPALTSMRYKAFISYSHAADGRLAPTLQSALQNFAKPWYALRAFRVFRDETDLAISPGLWPSILEALGSAEFFILLASEQAAASEWVEREVAYWLAHRQANHLLIVRTGGRIVWDAAASDFDWTATTALPRSLAHAFDAEPFHLDLSWARSPDEHLSLRHSAFRTAVLRVAAALTGRELAALDSEEVRQYRKNRRAAWAAGISVVLLAVVASLLAVLFRAQVLVATSQRLAAQADALPPERLDLALLLAVRALRTAPTFEARSSLLRAVWAQPSLSSFLTSGYGRVFAGPSFLPDSRGIAAVDQDGSIVTWTGAARTETREGQIPLGADETVQRSAVSPDGTSLAVAVDSTIYLWDIPGRRLVPAVVHARAEQVARLAFSPDGRVLAYVAGNAVVLWDVRTRRQRGDPVPGPNDVITDIAFVPGGQALLAVAGKTTSFSAPDSAGIYRVSYPGPAPNAVALLDVNTGRRDGALLLGHRTPVRALAVSPRTGQLASVDDDEEIILWDLRGRRGIRHIHAPGYQVNGMAFDPAGRRLATGGDDGSVFVLELGTGVVRDTLRGHGRAVAEVAFGGDGATLASRGSDWRIILWTPLTPPASTRLIDSTRSYRAAVVGRDGELAAAVTATDSITLWALDPPRQVGPAMGRDTSRIRALAISADGQTVAAGTADGRLTLWDVPSAHPKSPPVRIGDGGSVLGGIASVAFQPGGSLVACGDERGRVAFVDGRTGRIRRMQPVGTDSSPVLAIAFDPAGRLVATGGVDDSIRLWDATRLNERPRVVKAGQFGTKSLAFSPDGRILAAGGASGTIKLFSLEKGAWVDSLPFRDNFAVTSLSYDPSGRTLAAGSAEGAVAFWDVDRRAVVGRLLRPHRPGGITVAFAGRRTALSAMEFGDALLLWDVDPQRWAEHALSMAHRRITPAESTLYLGGQGLLRGGFASAREWVLRITGAR
jgi:WD40 repeat protein